MAMLTATFVLAGMGAGASAWAGQVAGVVVNLSGPLLDRKLDGTTRVLGVKSEIESGDTLVTEKNTYAQIRFIDNGDITLRPGTTFKVEDFAYESGKPEADSASFSLIKGGLRSITGLLGKRNKEKFLLKTPTATIGIRGTTFIAQYVEEPAAGAPAAGAPAGMRGPAALAPGLHVTVTDGAIVVRNGGGMQGIVAGQFGFVPGINLPPVLVPPNPGVQFTPPPTFGNGPATITPGATPAANGNAQAQQQGPDCVVR
jgi:hypothetical protein